MNMLSAASLVLFLVSACAAESEFIFEDCAPAEDAWIKFKRLDITPQPINVRGKIEVEVEVETSKEIGKEVRMVVDLKKSNLNEYVWQVPCTDIGIIGDAALGITGEIGTCKYKGSCDFPFIQSWVTKNECPAFFAEYDIPCQCPFPAQTIKTNGPVTVDLSQLKDYMPSWLIEGGYDVKAELRDTTNEDKLVGCLKMAFNVTNKAPCAPALARLNACP